MNALERIITLAAAVAAARDNAEVTVEVGRDHDRVPPHSRFYALTKVDGETTDSAQATSIEQALVQLTSKLETKARQRAERMLDALKGES